MMATWAIDFDWSEAQHLAGLDFAYDNCTEGSSAEDLVAKACAAIEQKDPSQQTSGKITQ